MQPRKSATRLVTAGLVAAGATLFAGSAHAQSNEQLLRMIQQLSAQVEELKGQVETAEMKGEQAVLAAADTKKKLDSADVKWKWGPAPTISSGDGKFEMKLRGRILLDFGHISPKYEIAANTAVRDRTGTEFRSARLGIEGKAWKDIKYKFEADFAENRVDLKDALIEYTGLEPVSFTVGYFKTPNSLDEYSSSRHSTFVENANYTEAFNIARRIGAKVTYEKNWLQVEAGIWGSGLSIPDTDANDEGYAFAARVVAFPKFGNNGQLHVAASVLYRDYENNIDNRAPRFRSRPHAHLTDTRYIDTRALNAGHDLLFGAELAAIFGPFWFESEWAWLKVGDISGKPDTNATFQGGYVGVGWFITGESRGYKSGQLDRPKVKNPVFEGGWGAVQLAARVDYVDLVDSMGVANTTSGIWGGEQLTYIVGLNWFLNNHTVVKVNYAHSDIDDAYAVSTGSSAVVLPNGKNKVDSVTVRFQVDW